jgi:uncharacterized membrane protein YoaK (UPF0700 family)
MTAADRPHGPLPVLLVCLTIVTGLVDAFSYLRLGHVFVANMTGNAVVLVVAVIASTAGVQGSPVRLLLIGLLGLAMGGQNAVVRRLSVPDLRTPHPNRCVAGEWSRSWRCWLVR